MTPGAFLTIACAALVVAFTVLMVWDGIRAWRGRR